MHAFVYDHDTTTDHVFTCTKCGAVIGFNKPGLGTPNAIDDNGTLVAPPEAEEYVTPCTVEGT